MWYKIRELSQRRIKVYQNNVMMLAYLCYSSFKFGETLTPVTLKNVSPLNVFV